MRNVKVPASENGSRLDRCLRRLLGYINQSVLEKSLRLGLILLDNKRTKSSVKVKSDQIIFYSNDIYFNKNDIKKDFDKQNDIYYRNLYDKIFIKETNEYIAFNKPSGLAVQGGSSQKYHIDGMLKNLFKDNNVPKLIHRIDKDTSGLLIVAKDQQTAIKFSNYFKQRKVVKTYLAIVSPSPKNEMGIINLPIFKGGFNGQQKMTIDNNRGKNAITEYKVLDRVSTRAALMALYPKTGRTHQLRVHLEHLNSPIVGDKKYSGSLGGCYLDYNSQEHVGVSQIKWGHKSIKSLQLHAYSISIPSYELIKAKVSDNFKKNLNFLGLMIPKNIDKMFK